MTADRNVEDAVPAASGLSVRRILLIAGRLLAVQAAISFAMGRLPICADGRIKFWQWHAGPPILSSRLSRRQSNHT